MTPIIITLPSCSTGLRLRIKLYPEGGCGLEQHVRGIGWVVYDGDEVEFDDEVAKAVRQLVPLILKMRKEVESGG